MLCIFVSKGLVKLTPDLRDKMDLLLYVVSANKSHILNLLFETRYFSTANEMVVFPAPDNPIELETFFWSYLEKKHL